MPDSPLCTVVHFANPYLGTGHRSNVAASWRNHSLHQGIRQPTNPKVCLMQKLVCSKTVEIGSLGGRWEVFKLCWGSNRYALVLMHVEGNTTIKCAGFCGTWETHLLHNSVAWVCTVRIYCMWVYIKKITPICVVYLHLQAHVYGCNFLNQQGSQVLQIQAYFMLYAHIYICVYEPLKFVPGSSLFNYNSASPWLNRRYTAGIYFSVLMIKYGFHCCFSVTVHMIIIWK